ncbi:unnamed protein product [Ostreobium quekettii]|uniref:Sulfotransferase n=1 Tax=Ostreobium quekettii TaxID=121088 RepID=A0A8S1J728_9CHLO|nr:unnamed protein product [Ostreobium quekettii]
MVEGARGIAHDAVAMLHERMGKLASREGMERALRFRPRPDDVFVAACGKAGTTWMLQVCHGLRTGGSMDFEEMCLEVPHIELAWDIGYGDLEKAQAAAPRLYKTHLDYHLTPKGAKYIYIVRDPKDMAISFFHFFQGWLFQPDELSLETFLREFVLADHDKGGAFWGGIASWWPHRADANVLWLHYEDMKADLPAAARLVSGFMGVGVGDYGLQELVVKQASFEFMKQHEAKFDDRHVRRSRNEAMGLPKGAGLEGHCSGKIREGRVGGHKASVPPDILRQLEERWSTELLPLTGYRTYAEMRAGVNRELQRSFAA